MSYYATNPWTSPPEDYGYCEEEYHFFLGWQEAVSALVAIWPAAGRSEVLTLQRIINADIADAMGKHGTWLLSSWAEDYATDIQLEAQHAVDNFAHGSREDAFETIDGMQDMIRGAIDKAERPEA